MYACTQQRKAGPWLNSSNTKIFSFIRVSTKFVQLTMVLLKFLRVIHMY